MKKRDFLLSAAAAFLTTIFLTPTLENLGVYQHIPFPLLTIFIVFPLLTIAGMFLASFIGRFSQIIWQLAKFGLVGVLNTTIDFGILNILIAVTSIQGGLAIVPLNIASFTIALINSYFWNKHWVFHGSKQSKFLLFLIVSLLAIAINTGVVYAMTTFMAPIGNMSPTVWANVAKVTATFVSLVWNFLGYKLIVFKK